MTLSDVVPNYPLLTNVITILFIIIVFIINLPYVVSKVNFNEAPNPKLNSETIRLAVQNYLKDGNTCIYGTIKDWDVSQVTDISYLFSNRREFNGDLSKWNVRNVTNMGMAFEKALLFNQDSSNWEVRNVRSLEYEIHV